MQSKNVEPFVENLGRISKQWQHSIKASQVPLAQLYSLLVHKGSRAPLSPCPLLSSRLTFSSLLLVCKKVKIARIFPRQSSLTESSLFLVREKKKAHSSCRFGWGKWTPFLNADCTKLSAWKSQRSCPESIPALTEMRPNSLLVFFHSFKISRTLCKCM